MPLTWRVLDEHPVASLDDYTAIGGGAALRLAREAPAEEVIALVRAAGLRGRGGAGFPTGTKWQTVAASRSPGEWTTVVVNAAEGEPGTFKDRALLRTNPYRVVEGATIAALAMETDRIRVAIKATFGREIQRLDDAIREMRAAGWLDGLDIELVLGPSSYLFGEETALLEVVEGRQPFPRVTPPYRRGVQEDDTRSVVGARLASIGGSEGAPALVDNVETLANVPLIVDRGPEWFRELGTAASPGTIVCTVSGATRRSGVGEVAMGSTLREVIDLIGWGVRPGRHIEVVLAGTANPLIPASLLDTPLTYEAMRDAGSGLGAAGFLVFDDTTEPAAVAAGVSRFLAVESCGQCEPCKVDGLFIADHLRRSLRGGSTSPDLRALRRRISTVTNGARCNLAQQQAAVAASLLDLFPHATVSRSGRKVRSIRPVAIAPIAELVGGRAHLDSRQQWKQPDWSYDSTDSGAAPAARLGNTPVYIDAPLRHREWPEWRASLTADHPLEIIDEAHDAIDRLIHLALTAREQDVERRVADAVAAVRTHVDVTQRVLYPMARRVGEEEGDDLVDAAEAQERTLARLTASLDTVNRREVLLDLAVELHAHAELDDKILEVLRAHLDPIECSRLADGLAAARATSTVSRLRRSAPTRRAQPPTAAISRPPEHTEQPVVHALARVHEPPTEPSATAVPSEQSPRAPEPSPDDRDQGPTFLVGLDGSSAAEAALEWTARLAGRTRGEIVVANVFEPPQAELAPDDYETLLDTARRRLATEWSAPLDRGAVRHRALQLTGAPDRLIDATEREDAALLVVGTRGAGRSPVLHVGSLAHHLAHYARKPLAIIPVAGATAPVDRIVLGLDGSSGGAAAAEWCASFAAACHAEVVAVCVFEPRQRRGFGVVTQEARVTAERAISDEWTAPLRAAGVTVRTRVVEGKHPAAALAAAATEEAAGMLVVGARALGQVFERRLVRVPLQLVHLKQLPVIMVPSTYSSSRQVPRPSGARAVSHA